MRAYLSPSLVVCLCILQSYYIIDAGHFLPRTLLATVSDIQKLQNSSGTYRIFSGPTGCNYQCLLISPSIVQGFFLTCSQVFNWTEMCRDIERCSLGCISFQQHSHWLGFSRLKVSPAYIRTGNLPGTLCVRTSVCAAQSDSTDT